jgi:hypothetical protein
MAKKPARGGTKWTAAEITKLKDLAASNTPTALIAHDLKRTQAAIYSKASSEEVSLKPVNRSPYRRRKKS